MKTKAGTARLLIVGANPRNLELLGQFLGGLGYETRSAATIQDFEMSIADQRPLDLVLLDITGFDQAIWASCARLQERDIPLLILSPRKSAEVQRQSMTHGARGILVKPLVMRELAGLVRSLLGD